MNLYINVNDQIPLYFSISDHPIENSWLCPHHILTENIDLEIEGIRSHYTPERVYDLIRKIFNKMCTATGMELREIIIRDNLRLFAITRGLHTIIYGLQLFKFNDDGNYVVFDRFLVNYINEIKSEGHNPSYHGCIEFGSKHFQSQIVSLFTI